ncbi:hypothetical protein BDQ17DRAFT_1383761 [Cyathus striatus]|nr:hypothetical protein BDQ17DRAFT_1383761 [Cyathus striatus]
MILSRFVDGWIGENINLLKSLYHIFISSSCALCIRFASSMYSIFRCCALFAIYFRLSLTSFSAFSIFCEYVMSDKISISN